MTERAYDDRPAPAGLERLRMLLNSDDRFHGVDHFDADDGPISYLRRNGVVGADDEIDPIGRRRLRELRDAVRAFLVEPGTLTVAALNAVSASHPLVARLESADRASLVAHRPRDAADQLVATELAVLHEAVRNGQWSRLRVCARDECQWVFYDSSRNRSARWCSADPCGDIMKSRAWRERQRTAAT